MGWLSDELERTKKLIKAVNDAPFEKDIVVTTRGVMPREVYHKILAEEKAEKEKMIAKVPELPEAPPKRCIPFTSRGSMYIKNCEPGCAYRTEDGCIYTAIARGDGTHAAPEANGKKCPWSGQNCTKECEMYVDGSCAFVLSAMKNYSSKNAKKQEE